MSNNAIEIRGLRKSFGKFLLDDISFDVEKGSVMGLIGENGAGKTTVIKLILNGYEKENGTIRVFDMDNIENEREVKARIGYVADEDYLQLGLNLKAHAAAYSKIYPEWDEKLFNKYVSLWDLDIKKNCNSLSKGTKTKAMLALALAHKPELLILDEPTGGLDPVARIEVLDILRDFVSDGERAVLFSTHITSDLDKIADYLTILIDGRVEESMALDAIEDKYAVISGNNDMFSGKEQYLKGFRKGTMSSEALVLRENLSMFPEAGIRVPNIENLLAFHIWAAHPERASRPAALEAE